MNLKEARFVLALILVIATTVMVMYSLATGRPLDAVMSTFGSLTIMAVTFYFGSKNNGS